MLCTTAAAVLDALGGHSIMDFIIFVLSDHGLAENPAHSCFLQERPEFLNYAILLPLLSVPTNTFIVTLLTQRLTAEVTQVANKESRWHFSVQNTSAKQIDQFLIKHMADRLETQAPTLWVLLGELLQSDAALARRHVQFLNGGLQESQELVPEWDEDAEYWAVDVFAEPEVRGDLEGVRHSGVQPTKCQRRAAKRTQSVQHIVSGYQHLFIQLTDHFLQRHVMIMSILIVTMNQKCNPTASMLGFFCHSTFAPELVVEVFAHAGLSISVTATHSMINSLSEKSSKCICDIAKTKAAGVAYDNLDIDLKSWTSTIDQLGTTLQHITSALIFPLEHGIELTDLKFTDELWTTDLINPRIPNKQRRQKRSWRDNIPCAIGASGNSNAHSGPSLKIRIIAWHF